MQVGRPSRKGVRVLGLGTKGLYRLSKGFLVFLWALNSGPLRSTAHPEKEPSGSKASPALFITEKASNAPNCNPKGPSSFYLWFLIPKKALQSYNREYLDPLGKLLGLLLTLAA